MKKKASLLLLAPLVMWGCEENATEPVEAPVGAGEAPIVAPAPDLTTPGTPMADAVQQIERLDMRLEGIQSQLDALRQRIVTLPEQNRGELEAAIVVVERDLMTARGDLDRFRAPGAQIDETQFQQTNQRLRDIDMELQRITGELDRAEEQGVQPGTEPTQPVQPGTEPGNTPPTPPPPPGTGEPPAGGQ